jgi:HPt (histidine-containing phosphotransfer) domain-containing protein
MRSAQKAIDYGHLETQTAGDRALLREVLALFLEHASSVLAALETTKDPVAWKEHTHSLKGSARGVGAFIVADAAEAAERKPFDAASVESLRAAFANAKAEIANRIQT